MFLATTALTEFWDTSDEIVFLGPWCLRYDRKEEWEGLRYSIVPNAWEDPRAIQDAERYCARVIDLLVTDLALYLNHLHGVRRSQRYWRILLGPWLLFYVHALYDRYVSLTCALETCSSLRTIALSPLTYSTPLNTPDFMRLAYNESPDLFNLQLYSQVLKAIGFHAIIWKEVGPSSARQDTGTLRESGVGPAWKQKPLPMRIVEQAFPILARMLHPRVMLGELDLDRRDKLRLLRAITSRGWALPGPKAIRCEKKPFDEVMRKGLSDIPARDAFTSVLIQTLPTHCPVVYLEGYADFREACLKMWPNPPQVLLSSGDWYFNEAFKFVAAEFGEYGSRLVVVQHGGGYGTSKVIPQEKYEFSIADRWLSFGWGDGHRNGMVRPVPHPRFLPLTNRGRFGDETAKDILLVTTSHPRYPFRFESQPFGRFDTVLEWRSRFIRALLDTHRAYLVVRLGARDFGWCQVQRLVEAFGPLRFGKSGRSLRQLLGQARVTAIEYYGTAFLEVLASNVPTVLFWDPKWWEIREVVEPYFDDLRKAGILWDSPEAAAAKVVEVYNDPWAWWGSEAVQEIRRRFVERYALGRKDWLDSWIRTIEEEMSLSRVVEQQ